MRSIALRLTVESPLAIRSDHAAGGATGVKSIPGTTLLGSLASFYRLLYEGSAGMEAFESLFLREQVLYPFLAPAFFDDEGLQEQPSPVYPLPITAATCKRHPGFLPLDDKVRTKKKHDGHGARDTLLDWALFKLVNSHADLQNKLQPLAIFQPDKNCRCGETMDRFEGYYRRSSRYSECMASAESFTRLQTHTGIHRESGTVQDRILYNRQVFEEGMRFWGEIIFPDDEGLLKQFETFAARLNSDGMLRMGTGRTRGMGKVRLALNLVEERDRFFPFTERLTAFNQALHKRASEFGLDNLPYKYFFALTLHSPLILCDHLLRYQSCISAKALQEALFPCVLPDLELVYHASSMARITGWQELWGTPRTGEYAIEPGSVFLFASSSPPDNECLQALFALEEQGMGKRRVEGFGRVCISDQFHQLVKQQEREQV